MISNKLFRQEAIEHQQHRLHGDVLLPPSMSIKSITFILLSLLVATGYLLVTGSYARQTEIKGWLEPSAGTVKLFPSLPSGSVLALYVHEGESVKKGQPLMKLASNHKIRGGGSFGDALKKGFEVQQKTLMASVSQKERLLHKQSDQIREEIDAISHDIKELEVVGTLFNQRMELLNQQQTQFTPLVKTGLYPEQDYQRLSANILNLQTEIEQLQRETSQQQLKLQKKQRELAILPEQHQLELNQIYIQISQIEQKIIELNNQHNVTLFAPQDGQISSLQIKTGQTFNASVPLLTLIPEGAAVEAKMLIPVSAAGFVSPGQHFDIRYHAFPFQKFGLHKGNVVNVSNTVLLPNEIANTPISIQEPAYIATATLNSQFINAYGKSIDLKSGMTFSASVKLAERTLLEWLFEPIYSLQGRMSQ